MLKTQDNRMNIRSLTAYEKPIVALINQLAQAHHYEYAAFLQMRISLNVTGGFFD